jgi:hypothetical protein
MQTRIELPLSACHTPLDYSREPSKNPYQALKCGPTPYLRPFDDHRLASLVINSTTSLKIVLLARFWIHSLFHTGDLDRAFYP